jgi:hypothetical protein
VEACCYGTGGKMKAWRPHRWRALCSLRVKRHIVVLVVAAGMVAALLLQTGLAHAQSVRRRFDPEDLKLEEPGVIHADVALGVVRGPTAGRWLVPDFDLDVGLTSNVELGLDGAVSLEGTSDRRYALDHLSGDNLWLSSKLGLWERRNDAQKTAWAVGTQLGPRVPVSPGAHGAGFQGLALLGRSNGPMHLVLNLGGLADPGSQVSRGRPVALLTGIDAAFDLDSKGTWSLAADLSGAFFASGADAQLSCTAGLVWSVSSKVDIGVSGLLGFLAGGDRYGVLVNLSPKLGLF